MFAAARDPLTIPETTYEEAMVPVAEGASLRVMRWTPDKVRFEETFLFVAGWVSVVQGWAGLIREMAKERTVVYVETREKASASLSRNLLKPDLFSIHQFSLDLQAAVRAMNLDGSKLIVSGSSLGASAVLEAIKHGTLSAKAAFLIGPNAFFHFPWWGHIVVSLPAATYHLTKYPVIAYLRYFRVDTKKEPEQMERYRTTLLEADPQRIKYSAMMVRYYEAWPELDSIAIPVAVAYAPTDTLHGEETVKRLIDAMPQAQAVPCESNKFMHGAGMVEKINRFVG